MQVSLVARIDAILPQTQCTQCGYPDCRGYAEALADGRAEIDQCPPGGDVGLEMLAGLLGKPIKPINPANGQHKPRVLALIDEQHCIGCTLCIQACPVDAIVGAAKQMHTVVATECTGCELCLPACPVDCIDLTPAILPARSEELKAEASRWRRRHEFHLFRFERDKQERVARLSTKALAKKNERQLAATSESQVGLGAPPLPCINKLSEPETVADTKAARIAEVMARAKRLREGLVP